jgi:hypothetical protein
VVGGTTLRLQQLLAQLGYLPLAWQPRDSGGARSTAAQVRAALHAPAGRFSWRYPNVPPELAAGWRPGRQNPVTQAALVAFEVEHGLPEDAKATADLWRDLLADATAGTTNNATGYSFVLITRSVPQTLTVWHDGEVVARTWVNTGTAASPTPLGSYPILQQAGNASEFGAGQSLHGSHRPSYGKPQSAGGTELPAGVAGKVWPYTPVGTLVTVTN